jgi:hypothetical protein
VQIATDLSDVVKEIIRSLPIANKKNELLALARLPHETQEAIAALLAAGDAKSVREAQRALNAKAGAPDPTPGMRRSPRGQTLAPQPAGVKVYGEDRDTLLHTVVAHLQRSSAITESQIAGRPAADVMAERLAALPRPELILLRALVVGQVQEAAASWVAAVRADVQNGVYPFEGVMRPDCHGDSADALDVQLASGADPAKTSAFPTVAAHPSKGDATFSGGQHRSAAVLEVRGDDGADPKVRADDDQRPFQWDSEGKPPPEQALPVQEEEKPSMQEPLGSAGAGDLSTANVPMATSVAPLPPCPECDSSRTWPIHGARPGRFACLNCEHNFGASTHGDVPSTRSQVSSHEMD